MFKHSESRLSAALLGYFILVILLLTLNPLRFALPAQITFSLQSGPANILSNIALFLPVGFFFRASRKGPGALLLGFSLSLGIELVQTFIPARTPSLVDLLANTLGAGLGSLLYAQLSARMPVTPGMVGRLRLETPLMGLMYLILPLLWANTVASNFSSRRWLLAALIMLCIAVVFSQLFRHWWDHTPLRAGVYSVLATGVWCLVGLGPTLAFSRRMRLLGLGILALAFVFTLLPRLTKERRFERATLSLVLPVFLIYLAGLTTTYFAPTWTAFHLTLGFTNSLTETSLQALLPRVEYLIAFTILGYLLAEWRGRAERPFKQDLPHLFFQAAGNAMLLELLAGFQTGTGASPIRAGMVVLGALFGGGIYHAFRAHIRFLLGH